jgi:hypothetical protein
MTQQTARPAPLRFRARLTPQLRGYIGVRLPRSSFDRLGTRGQLRVRATVNGVRCTTMVFPTGEGGHYLLVKQSVRRAAGAAEGDLVDVSLLRSDEGPRPQMTPPDLAQHLRRVSTDRDAWGSLTASMRRIASTWIDGAKDPSVRAWRIADVLRRARRYHAGEGPFYPQRKDQAVLSRPRVLRSGGR